MNDAERKALHPAFATARRMAAEGKMETEETEVDEKTATENKEKQKELNFTLFKSLNKFGQMDIDSIPKTEALTEQQAINVYSEIQDDCNQLGFPITALDELAVNKSCRPQNHGLSQEMMLNISKTLFRRLSMAIPSTNLVMKEMISPYTKDRDGYLCLWSLIRRSCDFMRPEPEGWGPPWPMNGTPEKYVIALQSWCSTTNIRNNKKYTHFQQSKEMLYQAALTYKPAIATKLDTELSLWYSTNANVTLPEAWRIEGIIDKFADYKHITVSSSITPGTPSINAFKDNRNAYNPGKKKFELKPIQCPCCKCAGHQIGDQVC